MKTYEVMISESVGKWIRVEAESQDEAEESVLEGNWTENDVSKEWGVDWFICESQEVKEIEVQEVKEREVE